jgi:hypothetical protein
MKYLLCIFFILFGFHSFAQKIQKGYVYEISSGKKPVSGVEIIARKSSVAISDNDGFFSLFFRQKTPGEPLIIEQLFKKGYEVVNREEVENWIFSEKIPFKVIMCREGYLSESRRKYYKIGEDYYKTKYNKCILELKNKKELNLISEKQFQDSLKTANEELIKSRKNLKYYTDKFAKINKDDLNSIELQAVKLMEEGKIDSAIKIYEGSKILEKFLMKLSVKDIAGYNVRLIIPQLFNQVDMLMQKSGIAERMKADTILHTIAKSDTSNFNYVRKYAFFLMGEGNYKDAFTWYKRALAATKTAEQRQLVYKELEFLYSGINDKKTADEYKKQIEEADN